MGFPLYAITMCNDFIFIYYHLHPSTYLHIFLFYSILSSIVQLYKEHSIIYSITVQITADARLIPTRNKGLWGCIICLTETWMSAMVPDSAIELTGFSVHRSDRTKELTGKSRGLGVCFFINNLWCDERNLHSIKSFCSPDLEFHMLLCRPFWLPREFTAIVVKAVYIPPQVNTDQALKELYGDISEQETVHPDVAFVVTRDFNSDRPIFICYNRYQ